MTESEELLVGALALLVGIIILGFIAAIVLAPFIGMYAVYGYTGSGLLAFVSFVALASIIYD